MTIVISGDIEHPIPVYGAQSLPESFTQFIRNEVL